MQYPEWFYRIPKNSRTFSIPTGLFFRGAEFHCFSAQNSSQDYLGCRSAEIFSFLRNHSVYQPKSNLRGIHFMGQPEQFYTVSKNLCTSLYTKIFLAVRNYSVYRPKINPYGLKRKYVILGR